jgi:hypothetical protein
MISIAFLALLITVFLQAVILQKSLIREQMLQAELEAQRALVLAQREQLVARLVEAETALAQTESLLEKSRSVRPPTTASAPAQGSTPETVPPGR